MSLQFEVSDLNDVPEQLKAHYVQTEGGTFRLNVAGVAPKSKVDEFRNNNIAILKERDALKEQAAQYQGLDPQAAKEALLLAEQVKGQKMVPEPELQNVLANQTERLKSDYEQRIQHLEKNLEAQQKAAKELNDRMQGQMLREQIQKAALAANVRESALPDITSRVQNTFRFEDEGKLVPRDNEGNILYNNDGTGMISIEDHIVGLQKSATHLFKENVGGGANGNNRDGIAQLMMGQQVVSKADIAAGRFDMAKLAKGEVKVVN